MKKLDIPENQLAVLRDFYEGKAKPIWERLTASQKQWEEIEPMLKQLGISFSEKEAANVTAIAPMGNGGYDKNWSWLRKAEFVLNGQGKNLSSLEIIDVLIENFEPTLEKQKAINSLPATLSVAAKHNKILRHKNENGEYVYEVKK